MTILAIVLSSLALLAASTALTLVIRGSRRSLKQNAALVGQIEELKAGTVPDYEQAKEAARAVNDFNAGISGILGFDPYAAILQRRDNGDGGGDS